MQNNHILFFLYYSCPFIVGLLSATLICYFIVPRLIKIVTVDIEITPPQGIGSDEWNPATSPSNYAGKWLGVLEVILYYVAFLIGKPELIAGWFVFKVGSKWEVWHNIVKVPDLVDGIDQIDYLRSRHNWGAFVLNRFTFGTLSNVIIAMLGTVIYRIVEISLWPQ